MSSDFEYLDYYIHALERRFNIVLYPTAAKCYRILQSHDLINHLRRVEQLGVISNVYKSAYHSRFEYAILHLYLINQLNEEEKGLGLRNDKLKVGNLKASGIEFLQTWVLLFNAGHLQGTFASERAFLRMMKKEESLRLAFIKGLPEKPNDIKEEFGVVVDKQKIYSFHRFIISFYLERFKKPFPRSLFNFKEYENSDFINFLQEIINIYENNKEEQLINIFKNLRLLSYLYLDSKHVNFPISFDLSGILLNFPDYIQELIKEPNSQILKTLNSFEDFLSTNVYHSSESIRELGYHANVIEEKILENKEKLTNPDKLYEFFRQDEKFKPKIKRWGDSINFYLLFNFNYPYFTERELLIDVFDTILYELEDKWNKDHGKISQFTYQQGSNRIHLVINLSFSLERDDCKNIELIAEFLKLMTILHSALINNFEERIKKHKGVSQYQLKGYKELLEDILKKPYLNLFISVLKTITKKDLFFEFRNNESDILAIYEKNDLNKAKERIKESSDSQEISKSRQHELKTLNTVLNVFTHEKPPKMIIPLSQLLVYDYTKDSPNLAEIDAIAIGVENKKLKILLIEAKDQVRSSEKDSKEDLLEKLKNYNYQQARNGK